MSWLICSLSFGRCNEELYSVEITHKPPVGFIDKVCVNLTNQVVTFAD